MNAYLLATENGEEMLEEEIAAAKDCTFDTTEAIGVGPSHVMAAMCERTVFAVE